MKSNNLYKLVLLFLIAISSVTFGAERIIYIRDSNDTSSVQKLLDKGWTIKHQNCAEGSSGRNSLLFTLVPPPEKPKEKVDEFKGRESTNEKSG